MRRLVTLLLLALTSLTWAATLEGVKPSVCELDPSNVFAQNLTAGWLMQCGGGSTIPDISGNGHTATMQGGAVCTDIGPPHGEVLVGLDTSTSVAVVPDDDDLDGGTALSLFVFVQPLKTGNTTNTAIFNKYGPSTDSYTITKRSNTDIGTTFKSQANVSSTALEGSGGATLEWFSVTSVIDVSGGPDATTQHYIVDGQLTSTVVSGTSIPDLPNTPHPVRIGNSDSETTSFYGYVSTAYFFKNYALTQAQAESLHTDPWQICKSGTSPVIHRRRADGY